MKQIIVIVAIAVAILACGGTGATVPSSNQPARSSSGSCSASEYKTQATAQMKRLQAIMSNINLNDASAVSRDKQKAQAILGDINSLSCRNAFPLKQETLEYSARHLIDVFKYVEADDLGAMQQSINKMEINVNAFFDWSMDMD